MPANHVYKGEPIVENGVVQYVRPVRSVQGADGKHYHGVKSVDARGNEFVYNRYPDDMAVLSPFLAIIEGSEFLAQISGSEFLARLETT